MNSTHSNSTSFDSKKRLRSFDNKLVITPEKPPNPPRRVLRSVKQVREAAKQLRKPDPTRSDLPDPAPDPVMSSEEEDVIRIVKGNVSELVPERYEMLDKFFHSLMSSVRLLRLKGLMSSFVNISRQVESLTDRSFGYSHLGQIKFIMPEAIEIKKILVRDDRTSCMKPDLHITLNFDIVENDEKLSSDSGYMRLTKLFRSRLLKFCKSNPKGEEIPQEKLPAPFNQSTRSTYVNAVQKPDHASVPDVTCSLYEQQPMAACHIPKSFKRHFSKQVPSQSVVTVAKDCVSDIQSPVKLSAKLPETPIKSIGGTQARLVSTPFTPAQSVGSSERCLVTPDEKSTKSCSKLTKRPSSRRIITFDTPVKNQTLPAKRVSVDDDDDDLADILSHDLLASIREKEQKALEEKNPEISQAKWRKQMVSRLPKLFDTLLFYFQSTKRTVITKPELLNMIVSNPLDIVDPREVDEQLRLLLELAPEWVYEKTASSGDLLFCVNKISSPESIRSRLLEAK